MLGDLETEEAKFESAGEFLLKLKREFGRRNKESVNVGELKRME